MIVPGFRWARAHHGKSNALTVTHKNRQGLICQCHLQPHNIRSAFCYGKKYTFVSLGPQKSPFLDHQSLNIYPKTYRLPAFLESILATGSSSWYNVHASYSINTSRTCIMTSSTFLRVPVLGLIIVLEIPSSKPDSGEREHIMERALPLDLDIERAGQAYSITMSASRSPQGNSAAWRRQWRRHAQER